MAEQALHLDLRALTEVKAKHPAFSACAIERPKSPRKRRGGKNKARNEDKPDQKIIRAAIGFTLRGSSALRFVASSILMFSYPHQGAGGCGHIRPLVGQKILDPGLSCAGADANVLKNGSQKK